MMRSAKGLSLVLLYEKINRYSINALLGALQRYETIFPLEIYLSPSNPLLLLKELLSRGKRVVVGFSFFTPQVPHIISQVREIKKRFPQVILVAGGPHPSGDPRGTLAMGFDVVVRGEGEETFPQLLQAIMEEIPLDSVSGVFFSSPKGEVFSGKRERVDLDIYPPFSERYRAFGPIEISRGCPFGCFFCQTSYLFGKQVRHRSPSTLFSYVEIYTKRGMRDIRFITPNAFSYGSRDGRKVNVQALEELLRGVRSIVGEQGRIFFGSFPSEVRPEHVTEETLSLVREYADNDNLVIGAQSGSERILEICHRRHSVKDIYRATGLCLKYGLLPKVDFIFGLPEEREEDIRATVKVMRELIEMGAKIHAHTFIPLPGTPFSRKPPGRLSLEIKSFIKQVLPFGRVFGEWERQEKMAQRVWRVLNKEKEKIR